MAHYGKQSQCKTIDEFRKLYITFWAQFLDYFHPAFLESQNLTGQTQRREWELNWRCVFQRKFYQDGDRDIRHYDMDGWKE